MAARKRRLPTLLASNPASAPCSSLSLPQREVQVRLELLVAQPTPLLPLMALVSVCRSFCPHEYIPGLTLIGVSSDGSPSETGAAASASTTGDSDNGAVRNSIAGAGLLGLVVAGLAL